ncbi:MAG: cyclodeaminase/cyclohydrolase family protein [Elusimicrobiota bacterium]|nr:cyclodeaminase/cyclohydrolase family protein [Elusimicrobiota bacterium]
MTFLKDSVKSYLEKLGKKIPVPGGGSAAALSGAMGAALIEMSAAYSVKTSPRKIKIKKALADIKKIRRKLEKQIDADGRAYEYYRKTKTDSALKKAAEAPLTVCSLCGEALPIGLFVAQNGNINLKSDAVSGAYYLLAGFNGAAMNVDENIKRVKDKTYTRRAAKRLAALRKQIK